MEIYSLFSSLISLIPSLMACWFLLKKWYRFSPKVSISIFAALNILEYMILYRCVSQETLAWVHLLAFFLALIPIRKEMITRSMIITVFFDFLYNVVGTIVMVILVNIYAVFSGADNTTWFADENNTVMDYIFCYIMMPVSGGISCYISYRILPLLEKLTKKELFWIAIGLVLPMLTFETFSRLTIKSADDYYGGFVIVCYGLMLFVMGLSCILCVLITTLRIRAERKEMQIRMELQSSQYEEICRLQEGVRELRHDLINHMAAGTLSTAGVSDIVKNFQKRCL